MNTIPSKMVSGSVYLAGDALSHLDEERALRVHAKRYQVRNARDFLIRAGVTP